MDFSIVEGPENIRLDDVVRLLRMTYWARQRPVERIEASLRHSDCYGVWAENEHKLVGFARVITDYATTYYLCDVVIDEAYRHQGLGINLLSHIESRPEYTGLRGILLTRDAHGLYAKYGYQPADGRAMTKQN